MTSAKKKETKPNYTLRREAKNKIKGERTTPKILHRIRLTGNQLGYTTFPIEHQTCSPKRAIRGPRRSQLPTKQSVNDKRTAFRWVELGRNFERGRPLPFRKLPTLRNAILWFETQNFLHHTDRTPNENHSEHRDFPVYCSFSAMLVILFCWMQQWYERRLNSLHVAFAIQPRSVLIIVLFFVLVASQ